ncbi:hypothetical protein LEP1GSC193_0500 [Leptospira alstonii serovar Pingchang str. 80-412]|uniref:Uncharacterized protein n=2 Tax=Leptospira alstonii TaxID=28452 RepID=M6CKX8_9LEPT|nr:hypothetical protein LEP1GSC194_0700 [Leptospira alstonii serovar Sichuan str. 79601]EQA79460.1 hypothetical protein LEP1GSC193_0500 [Leptospira alstonii serovar Pingchang str. 80-412]
MIETCDCVGVPTFENSGRLRFLALLCKEPDRALRFNLQSNRKYDRYYSNFIKSLLHCSIFTSIPAAFGVERR